jgi:hypothetical protein
MVFRSQVNVRVVHLHLEDLRVKAYFEHCNVLLCVEDGQLALPFLGTGTFTAAFKVVVSELSGLLEKLDFLLHR